ncbi:MAG: class I SAM-dependent methyltransferase [Nanoarchaeota archaeon]|nr:class I SAM-dependent methyltransferase [Nanoarchaeota archaeon]
MYYDTIAEGYDELHKEEQLKKLQFIAVRCQPHGLLLDLGAGTGIAANFFSANTTAIAVDPSVKLLEQYQGLKVLAKAECLPFKDHVFDTVISLTALHLTDWQKSWKEIKRVAKPNALIVLTFLAQAKNVPSRIYGFQKMICGPDIMFIKDIGHRK